MEQNSSKHSYAAWKITTANMQAVADVLEKMIQLPCKYSVNFDNKIFGGEYNNINICGGL